jgi:hypothetical protein
MKIYLKFKKTFKIKFLNRKIINKLLNFWFYLLFLLSFNRLKNI